MSEKRSLGQWNAYCETGETHEERKRRLEEAPKELRPQILIHLKTAYSLSKWHKRKKAQPLS